MQKDSIWMSWNNDYAYLDHQKKWVGLTLVCDLYIPPNLHSKFESYPIFFTNQKVHYSDLSSYQKKMVKDLKCKPDACNRLLAHLYPITSSPLDYRLLQWYLKKGVALKGISTIISYTQTYFVKDQVDFNAEKRRQATYSFEKINCKNLSSFLVGKMQSLGTKFTTAKLVQKKADLKQHITSPFFDRFHELGTSEEGDTVGLSVFKTKDIKTRNSLISAAFLCLNLSKMRMFSNFYDCIVPLYKQINCHVTYIYGDTDSNCCLITPFYSLKPLLRLPYKPLQRISPHLDVSNLLPDHPIFDGLSEARIREWQQESPKKLGTFSLDVEEEIEGFVGFKSKVYALQCTTKTKLKLKGVRLNFTDLKYDSYLSFMYGQKIKLFAPQFSFISKKHQKFTKQYQKMALNFLDLKCFQVRKNFNLPFGHFLIPFVRIAENVIDDLLTKIEQNEISH